MLAQANAISWPDESSEISLDHMLEKAISARDCAQKLIESGAPPQVISIMKRDADHWSRSCGVSLD